MAPGASLESEKAGGLLFTEAEIKEFKDIANECGHDFEFSALESV